MSLKFGTDGVRGPADELTDELVGALGTAAARVLGASRFVIGRDTRESGPRLDRALRLGIEAAGVPARSIGVLPTPAVACLAARDGVGGAVISASHNAFGDNGIKFFAPGGLKLTDAVEEALEAELAAVLDGTRPANVAAAASGAGPAGVADADPAALSAYEDLVLGSVEGRDLTGLRVVVDCANGAASAVGPDVLRRLGAEVEVLHAAPDGRNINRESGSTHPAVLQAAVVAAGAHAGLAFDGDADRVLAVDEHGGLIDGDQLIALCAVDLRERGALAHDTVVVTVMSNLGFHRAMAAHGIEVAQTQVGDRYVLEALEEGGFVLGGEQSGHVIFRRLATTGDGLLTGVQLLDLLHRSGRPLSALASEVMEHVPQVLLNVRVAHRDPDVATAIADDIAAVEAELDGRGRVLVRPSGTEPLVRVMVEADDDAAMRAAADRLADAVVRVCGAVPAP